MGDLRATALTIVPAVLLVYLGVRLEELGRTWPGSNFPAELETVALLVLTGFLWLLWSYDAIDEERLLASIPGSSNGSGSRYGLSYFLQTTAGFIALAACAVNPLTFSIALLVFKLGESYSARSADSRVRAQLATARAGPPSVNELRAIDALARYFARPFRRLAGLEIALIVIAGLTGRIRRAVGWRRASQWCPGHRHGDPLGGHGHQRGSPRLLERQTHR